MDMTPCSKVGTSITYCRKVGMGMIPVGGQNPIQFLHFKTIMMQPLPSLLILMLIHNTSNNRNKDKEIKFSLVARK